MRFITTILCGVGLMSLIATSTFAEWICIHGSIGMFENERKLKPRTTWTDEYRFPWGLEFRIPPQSSVEEGAKIYASIHYTIPVYLGHIYSKLRIHFTTENFPLIKTVTIRDGGWSKIQEWEPWLGYDYGPDWRENTKILGLDRPHRFASSVGVTLGISSVLDTYWDKGQSSRLYIHSVCLGN